MSQHRDCVELLNLVSVTVHKVHVLVVITASYIAADSMTFLLFSDNSHKDSAVTDNHTGNDKA